MLRYEKKRKKVQAGKLILIDSSHFLRESLKLDVAGSQAGI